MWLSTEASVDGTPWLTDNVTTSVSTRFELRRLQGRQVLHIVDMTVDFDIQGMTVNLENLFNGNKVLGEWTHFWRSRNR